MGAEGKRARRIWAPRLAAFPPLPKLLSDLGRHRGAFEQMTGAAVVVAIIIGALYFGREVFVPIALAILLSFVLAPVVRALQRLHVPRGLSVGAVALLAFA